MSGWAASIRVANIAANVRDACTARLEACQRAHGTADASRGMKVHGRTAAFASMVDPPLTHTRMSNHQPMRMECPPMAAALQTGERHMYLSMLGAAYEPGMRSSLGG